MPDIRVITTTPEMKRRFHSMTQGGRDWILRNVIAKSREMSNVVPAEKAVSLIEQAVADGMEVKIEQDHYEPG